MGNTEPMATRPAAGSSRRGSEAKEEPAPPKRPKSGPTVWKCLRTGGNVRASDLAVDPRVLTLTVSPHEEDPTRLRVPDDSTEDTCDVGVIDVSPAALAEEVAKHIPLDGATRVVSLDTVAGARPAGVSVAQDEGLSTLVLETPLRFFVEWRGVVSIIATVHTIESHADPKTFVGKKWAQSGRVVTERVLGGLVKAAHARVRLSDDVPPDSRDDPVWLAFNAVFGAGAAISRVAPFRGVQPGSLGALAKHTTLVPCDTAEGRGNTLTPVNSLVRSVDTPPLRAPRCVKLRVVFVPPLLTSFRFDAGELYVAPRGSTVPMRVDVAPVFAASPNELVLHHTKGELCYGAASPWAAIQATAVLSKVYEETRDGNRVVFGGTRAAKTVSAKKPGVAASAVMYTLRAKQGGGGDARGFK
jgi:hypothetical protein